MEKYLVTIKNKSFQIKLSDPTVQLKYAQALSEFKNVIKQIPCVLKIDITEDGYYRHTYLVPKGRGKDLCKAYTSFRSTCYGASITLPPIILCN